MYDFRWNDWNIDHIGAHGIGPADAEYVVNHARPPYPERTRDNAFLVRGQTEDGAYIQVVYIIEGDDVAFVFHARELSENEKRRLRRRKR